MGLYNLFNNSSFTWLLIESSQLNASNFSAFKFIKQLIKVFELIS